jgi:DNA primase
MFFRGKNIDPIKLWSEYCEIKDEGGEFLPLTYCPNPNHSNSRSPAFQINIEKPMVHCFSYCGISGTYEHAICVIEGIYEKNGITKKDLELARTRPSLGESTETRRIRARVSKCRKEAKRTILIRASNSDFSRRDRSASRSRNRLSDSVSISGGDELSEDKLADYSYLPKEALNYLSERGIDQGSRSRWQIGFNSETERVTIPVRDRRDRLKFVIERAIYKWQRPAYLYPDSSAKSALLFGTCALDRSMVESQGLILVEGSIDCIRMHQHGYRNTVALLGNSLSNKQLKEITRLQPKLIVLFLDRDEAGVRGLERAASMLDKKYSVKVALYPQAEGNLDPAALSKRQVDRAIAKAIPVLRVKKRLKRIRETV